MCGLKFKAYRHWDSPRVCYKCGGIPTSDVHDDEVDDDDDLRAGQHLLLLLLLLHLQHVVCKFSDMKKLKKLCCKGKFLEHQILTLTTKYPSAYLAAVTIIILFV
jgi:hypothetical protein